MRGRAVLLVLVGAWLVACAQGPLAAVPTPGATAATLSPTVAVRLYYYNQPADTKDGNVACSPEAVLPVERAIPASRDLIGDTIRLLLQGRLTEEEQRAGFRTEFPGPGFTLESAQLQEGVLTLRFADPNYFSSGGSCRVTLLRAQVEKTARQFPDVREVHIEPEAIFQP